MCILLNVKKHEKTFALNVDIFKKIQKFKKSVDISVLVRYTNEVGCESSQHEMGS